MKRLARKIAGVGAGVALALGLSVGAQATELNLPPAQSPIADQFGDFRVWSLELNAACGAAGDARCQPFIASQYPVSSSPGSISDQLVIYQGSNGNDNTPTPFPALPTALYDNPFRSPSGSITQFDMNASNEPGTGNTANGTAEFAGDLIGTWQVRISDLLDYLTSNGVVHDLVFLFDNNQQGASVTQFMTAWGQVQITDAAGNQVGNNCFELRSTLTTGCGPIPSESDSSVPPFVPIIGDFCVDRITLAAYNTGPTGDGGIAGNAGDCDHNVGDYFISNNLGQSTAEFAIFNSILNAAIQDGANADNFLTVNLKLRDLTDGDEQLWICSACTVLTTPIPPGVPMPAALVVVGSGLLTMAVATRKRHATS